MRDKIIYLCAIFSLLFLTAKSWGQTNQGQHTASTPHPSVYPAEINTLLSKLKDEGRVSLATSLMQEIERHLGIVKRVNKGFVVVGQVLMDGKGALRRSITSQMRTLEDGYFVTDVGSAQRPLVFTAHGYAPYSLTCSWPESGLVSYVGAINMKPLKKSDAASIKGQIVWTDRKDDPEHMTSVDARVRVSCSESNHATGGNGSCEGDLYIPLQVDSSGMLSQEGFSPLPYWMEIKSPGYAQVSKKIEFRRGQLLDLGQVRLSPIKTVRVDYAISKNKPFTWSEPKSADVKTDGLFRPEGAPWPTNYSYNYGYTWELKNQDEQLILWVFYQEGLIADLGEGSIKTFITKTPENAEFKRQDVKLQDGHVYLMNHKHFGYWILFEPHILPSSRQSSPVSDKTAIKAVAQAAAKSNGSQSSPPPNLSAPKADEVRQKVSLDRLTSTEVVQVALGNARKWQKDALPWRIDTSGRGNYEINDDTSRYWNVYFASGVTKKLFQVRIKNKDIESEQEQDSLQRTIDIKSDQLQNGPSVNLKKAINICIQEAMAENIYLPSLEPEYLVEDKNDRLAGVPRWSVYVPTKWRDGRTVRIKCEVSAITGKVLRLTNDLP